MSCVIRIDPATGFGVVVAAEPFAPDDFIAALRDLWTDPGYRWSTLWDLSAVNLAKFRAPDFLAIQQAVVRERVPGMRSRFAFVVRDVPDFATVRMASGYLEHLFDEFQVFLAWEPAWAWLVEPNGVSC